MNEEDIKLLERIAALEKRIESLEEKVFGLMPRPMLIKENLTAQDKKCSYCGGPKLYCHCPYS